MTLAGTRPPLISETNLYELHHRARLAIKPGITGMWQVSGRSDITDFEEVVRLDKEYITNWNIGLDISKYLVKAYKKYLMFEYTPGYEIKIQYEDIYGNRYYQRFEPEVNENKIWFNARIPELILRTDRVRYQQ